MIIVILLIILIILTSSLLVYRIYTKRRSTSLIVICGGSKLNLFEAERKVELTDLRKGVKCKESVKDIEKEMMYISDNWKTFEKNWPTIVKLIHPFDKLKTELNIKSSITEKPTFRPTNAFMKMYEALLLLKEDGWYDDQKIISMFDIASAPGMFILAVDKFTEKYKKDFTWYATSYVPEGDDLYLQDEFGIYKSHPDKFLNANILLKEDIDKMLKIKEKFNLVTGDIGMPHGFDDLQEKHHHELQWGQAYVATKLCQEGGAVYLKMYSHIYPTSIHLIHFLSKCFKKLYIIKPFTSRIMNHESYILGIYRNDVSIDDMSPVLEEEYSEDTLNNFELIHIQNACRNFHYELAKAGNEEVIKANNCINKHKKYEDKNSEYKKYLMNEFPHL